MSALKHDFHRVNNAVQTACCASFLSKSHDAERLLLAMLNHRHDLCSKFNLLQVQVCRFVSFYTRYLSVALELHTVLSSESSKDNVALLVDLNASHAITAPFAQQNHDLLTSSLAGQGHAKVASGWLDAE